MPPWHSPPQGNYPLLSCGQLELQKSLSLENQIFGATARVVFHFVGIAQGLNLISCLVGVTTPHQVVKGMLCGLIVSKSKFLFSSRAHLQFHTATISREHQHQVCVGIPLSVSYESQFSGKEKCVGGASLFAYGRNFGKKVSSSTCQRWLKHLDLIHRNMQSS